MLSLAASRLENASLDTLSEYALGHPDWSIGVGSIPRSRTTRPRTTDVALCTSKRSHGEGSMDGGSGSSELDDLYTHHFGG